MPANSHLPPQTHCKFVARCSLPSLPSPGTPQTLLRFRVRDTVRVRVRVRVRISVRIRVKVRVRVRVRRS